MNLLDGLEVSIVGVEDPEVVVCSVPGVEGGGDYGVGARRDQVSTYHLLLVPAHTVHL